MKLKDIFNIDLSTRGGAKLYRKIMGKYNIPKQDSKQLVKEIRNSSEGGGSSKVKYYNCIDETARGVAASLIEQGFLAYINCYTYDSNNNPIDTYICNNNILKDITGKFAIKHIVFQPISIVAENNRIVLNSFEEAISLLGGDYIEHFKEITEEEFYTI